MERTKNALLFVIALCLVLIVLRLYSSGDFVKEARAESDPSMPTSGPIHDVHLWGCRESAGRTCKFWIPVIVSPTGNVYVKPGYSS